MTAAILPVLIASALIASALIASALIAGSCRAREEGLDALAA
jgi:hypothetical protein